MNTEGEAVFLPIAGININREQKLIALDIPSRKLKFVMTIDNANGLAHGILDAVKAINGGDPEYVPGGLIGIAIDLENNVVILDIVDNELKIPFNPDVALRIASSISQAASMLKTHHNA